MKHMRYLFIAICIALFVCGTALAQDDAAELAKKAQNPVASMISLPFQNNINFGFGPDDEVQNVLNIQPVIPFSLSKDWNLITRTIIPLVYTPWPEEKFGLGDINLSLFLTDGLFNSRILLKMEAEARVGAWHQLVGNFATYTPAKPGTGQFGMTTYRDKDGNALIGSHTYRLRVPAKVPVKQFWQIPVYEVATRSMIGTDQKKSALSSTQDLQKNADGSVDLYFGPELPEGVSEKNWIKTKPGEGWFTLPRLYAPLEPILDKTWRWNDIERVK